MAILNKRSTFNGTTIFVLFVLLAFIGKVKAGFYDDWWICVEKCCETCADCVDSCTDDFNSSQSLEPKEPPSFKLTRTPRGRESERKSGLVKLQVIGDYKIACPPGTVPTAFPMPIYDEETGLWVVDYETVWFCIDEDLEPEG